MQKANEPGTALFYECKQCGLRSYAVADIEQRYCGHCKSFANADNAPPLLFAWVGEDELGSGRVGLKQGSTNLGIIPLVAISTAIARSDIQEQLQEQANRYGKAIKLCRYVYVETLIEVTPKARH